MHTKKPVAPHCFPRWIVGVAGAVLSLALNADTLAQAPGAGDPSFPKETPKPKQEQPEEKPRKPSTTPQEPRSAAGMVDLRPRFKKGQEIRYVMRMTSENDVSIPGLVPQVPRDPNPRQPARKDETGQNMSQEIGFVLRVKESSPDEGATVEMVYERMKISMKTGDSEIDWDSSAPKRANDDSDLFEPIFKGLIGTKLTMKFDAQGNIKDVQGGNELALPGALSRAGIDPKSMGSLFGPINTSKSGNGLYRVGEKWSNVDDVDTGPIGRFKMVTEHTLRAARNGTADVHFTSRIEPGSESGKPGSPFQVKDSRCQGKYVWDTASGQLKSMESEQEVTIDPGPGGKGGMKSKMTVRVERESPARPR